jgi:hypothetical protein
MRTAPNTGASRVALSTCAANFDAPRAIRTLM